MLERTAELVKKCREWYAAYDFHRVYHAIHDFCVVDLSAFYFDVLKDRLYTKAPKSESRRSAQTAMWKITSSVVRLLTPVLVFTAEEIWRFLPRAASGPDSVHMSVFPESAELRTGLDQKRMEIFENLAKVRSAVLLKLEEARNAKTIGGALEAKVILSGGPAKLHELLMAHARELPALFIVSQVEVQPGAGDSAELGVEVKKADGAKCERCWNYSVHVGENLRYPTICERCTAALNEIESLVAG
jgi:isoleucyl-tRNA synthetase